MKNKKRPQEAKNAHREKLKKRKGVAFERSKFKGEEVRMGRSRQRTSVLKENEGHQKDDTRRGCPRK